MQVYLRLVPVRMGMLDAGRNGNIVLVLVVFVMNVFMIVPDRRVGVFVFMTLGQMQPGTQSHQGSRDEQRQSDGFAHQHR